MRLIVASGLWLLMEAFVLLEGLSPDFVRQTRLSAQPDPFCCHMLESSCWLFPAHNRIVEEIHQSVQPGEQDH